MTTPSPTAFIRLKRVAAFVAIVWALAASFVAFDLAALAGFDLALGTGAGRALGLSADVRNSTACTVPAGAHPDPARVNGAAATAWVLGLMSGTHAFVSRWDDDGNGGGEPSTPQWRSIARERSAQAARNVEQLAAELQVTKPGPFEARNRVDANIAYVTAVEKNDNETARTIAAQYGESICHAYKLGAYWGYAAELRVALPGQRSVFAIEIEYHARKAGVPEPLWTPVLVATPSNATTEQLVKETGELGVAITNYLAHTP
jgi:hypothetical protein